MIEGLPAPTRQALFALGELERNFDAQVQNQLDQALQSNTYLSAKDFIEQTGLTENDRLSQPKVNLVGGRIFIPHRRWFRRHLPLNLGNINCGTNEIGIYLDPDPDQPTLYQIQGAHPLNRIFGFPDLEDEFTWEEIIQRAPQDLQFKVFDKLMSFDLDKLELRNWYPDIIVAWDKIGNYKLPHPASINSRWLDKQYHPKDPDDWEKAWGNGIEYWRKFELLPSL